MLHQGKWWAKQIDGALKQSSLTHVTQKAILQSCRGMGFWLVSLQHPGKVCNAHTIKKPMQNLFERIAEMFQWIAWINLSNWLKLTWVHTFCAQITAAMISAICLNQFKQFADVDSSKSLKTSASNEARTLHIFIECVQMFRGWCWESSPTIRCNDIFKSLHSSFAFRFWTVVRVGRASVSLMQGPTLKFRVVRCRLSNRRQCNTGAPNKSSRFENFRQKLLSLSIWRWNIWEFNKKSQMRIFIGDSDTSGQKSHFGETP